MRVKRLLHRTAKEAHTRFPILVREGVDGGNTWNLATRPGLFNMTGSSKLFRSYDDLVNDGMELVGNVFHSDRDEYCPLYEGKMFTFYDHRYAGVVISARAQIRQGQADVLDLDGHQNPEVVPIPRYWVRRLEVESQCGSRERGWILEPIPQPL